LDLGWRLWCSHSASLQSFSIERQKPGADSTHFMELFIAFDGINLLAFAGLVLAGVLYRQRRDSIDLK